MKAIERIFDYINLKKINKSELEKKAGISNGYLAKQLQRKADVGEGILNNIIKNCPDINPEWLLTGNGTMLKQHTKNTQIIGNNNNGNIHNENYNEINAKLVDTINKQAEQISALIAKL